MDKDVVLKVQAEHIRAKQRCPSGEGRGKASSWSSPKPKLLSLSPAEDAGHADQRSGSREPVFVACTAQASVVL